MKWYIPLSLKNLLGIKTHEQYGAYIGYLEVDVMNYL